MMATSVQNTPQLQTKSLQKSKSQFIPMFRKHVISTEARYMRHELHRRLSHRDIKAVTKAIDDTKTAKRHDWERNLSAEKSSSLDALEALDTETPSRGKKLIKRSSYLNVLSDTKNYDEIALILHHAFQAIDTNERFIIQIISGLSHKERESIAERYKALFNNDINSVLENEFGGHFLAVTVAMFTPTLLFEVKCLHKALTASEPDVRCFIEIVLHKTTAELETMRSCYEDQTLHSMEDDINAIDMPRVRDICWNLIRGQRNEKTEKNMQLASLEADDLITEGSREWGNVGSKFSHIIGLRSLPQLYATFMCLSTKEGRNIEVITSDPQTGEAIVRQALLTIIKLVRNYHRYMAEQLFEAMKWEKTDDEALIRLIISRSEIDLNQIKREYMRMFKKDLEDSLKYHTSGDYFRLLLKILERAK